MMKEIHEQPKAIQELEFGHPRRPDRPEPVGLTDEEIREVSQLYMVACGSAWHVGMEPSTSLRTARPCEMPAPAP